MHWAFFDKDNTLGPLRSRWIICWVFFDKEREGKRKRYREKSHLILLEAPCVASGLNTKPQLFIHSCFSLNYRLCFFVSEPPEKGKRTKGENQKDLWIEWMLRGWNSMCGWSVCCLTRVQLQFFEHSDERRVDLYSVVCWITFSGWIIFLDSREHSSGLGSASLPSGLGSAPLPAILSRFRADIVEIFWFCWYRDSASKILR